MNMNVNALSEYPCPMLHAASCQLAVERQPL